MPCEIFLGGINMTDTMEEVLEMRRMWKKNDDARDAGLPREVPGVRRIDDLSYGPSSSTFMAAATATERRRHTSSTD